MSFYFASLSREVCAMLRKLTLALFAITVVALPAQAETVTLKAGHPDRYVVKKGDTLWDISGRFLDKPWRWPEIWQANPRIQNPDLIYPGDELVLSYEGGQPVLRARRNAHPTVRLSPRVRVVRGASRAIPTIPVEAISQFLSRPRVVGEHELDRAPYIMSLGKEALIGRAGRRVYARGIHAKVGTQYTVLRRGGPYLDPTADNGKGEVLGYEALHIADAVLTRAGDPATLVLSRTTREVLAGDRVVPVGESAIESNFMPRPPAQAVSGRIISVVDGVTQIGQYQVVVLNLGRRDGIEAGNVMAVYQKGAQVVDRFAQPPEAERSPTEPRIELDAAKQGGVEGFARAANALVVAVQTGAKKLVDSIDPQPKPYQLVSLPDERAGTIMVFRPYERISYALVMKSSRAIHVLDTVTSP